MFKIVNAASRDPPDLDALQADLGPHRERLLELLEQGARGRDPPTARFCAGVLERYH